MHMNDSVAETNGVEEGETHTLGQGEEKHHTHTHTKLQVFSEPITTLTAFVVHLGGSVAQFVCQTNTSVLVNSQ